jgi:hypothetical protein
MTISQHWQCMSNGLKNIQAHARAYARRERLEAGQLLSAYDDDSGIAGIGLTPIPDVPERSYGSEPESPSVDSSHSTPNGSPYLVPSHLLPTVEHMGIASLVSKGDADEMSDEPLGKSEAQDLGVSTHHIAEDLNISSPPPSVTRDGDVEVISTTPDQAFTPTQPHSPQASRTPAEHSPSIEISDAVPSPDINGESSDAPEGSSPSSVTTTTTSTSSSFLGTSVSEASTDMSYSFIRSPEHRRGMLDCVVQWLGQWIDQQFQGFVFVCCSGAEDADRRPGSPTTHTGNDRSKADTCHRQNAKGKRRADDDLPNDDSDDDSRRDSKRPKPDSSAFSSQRRFACPFFKRNPTRYQEVRSCFGPGFKTIHRLKSVTSLIGSSAFR